MTDYRFDFDASRTGEVVEGASCCMHVFGDTKQKVFTCTSPYFDTALWTHVTDIFEIGEERRDIR